VPSVDVEGRAEPVRQQEMLVEVLSGLCAGEPVVRDLAAVMADDPFINATMLGFYNPGDIPR
jgi:hypothetical protein